MVENSRKKYQMYKKVFDVTVHLLNSWWKKIWELKNEDEEVACVWAMTRCAEAASHEVSVLLLVCAWSSGYRGAKAAAEDRLQNLKEIISDEMFKSKHSQKCVS